MKAVSQLQHRKPGRPATYRDKNGRVIPVRPDRDVPLKFFFQNIRRDGLEEALQLSGDNRFYRLHDALHDDAYSRTSPATLCRRFGISLQDLFELWRQYNLCLGTMRLATELPAVMEDVAVNALSRECPVCGGTHCPTDSDTRSRCEGCEGRRRLSGDWHPRRLTFEIVGLIRRYQLQSATGRSKLYNE
jgi:hypothetical protein